MNQLSGLACLLVFTFIFSLGFSAGAFAAEKLPPGVIAVAESPMNWSDAKTYCQQQGGRLPHINNSDSLAMADRSQITHIDGFGAPGGPWPSGLPIGTFWTDTVNADSPDSSWIVSDLVGGVDVVNVFNQSATARVACVP